MRYHLFCLFGLFFLTLYLFWPGILRSDSLVQYQEALKGCFNDHHPPMMAATWGLLNKIYPGPGLMLLFHWILLWGAALIFSVSFKNILLRWVFVFIPLMPQILGYGPFILKDSGFTLSFLFCCSLLSFYTIHKEKMPYWVFLLSCMLLFYGSAVKFQGVFILPVLALWYGLVLNKNSNNLNIKKSIIIYLGLFSAVTLFNQSVTQTKNYSWQYVKLYDLAGMSLNQNTNLFPAWSQENPNFSLARIHSLYSTIRVDELVWGKDVPLMIGKNQLQRHQLSDAWRRAVLDNPKSYLVHRFGLFKTLVSNSSIKSLDSVTSLKDEIPHGVQSILKIMDQLHLTKIVNMMSSFLPYILISIGYFIYGCLRLRKTVYAYPLVFLNGIALLLLWVLFFFSMAADGRYIYLTHCCFHFSHPFFYACLKNKTN